jgi:hypothetical protein
MVLYVPAQPIPNQTVNVVLDGQASTLNIYQKSTGLFLDLLLGTVPIVQGIICLNYSLIVRNTYFGFIGDLVWYDTQGNTDPVYTGFGQRYFLAYLEASDIAALNLPAGVE